MRLIDAEALVADYEAQLEAHKDSNSLADRVVRRIFRRIIEDINKRPTVERTEHEGAEM